MEEFITDRRHDWRMQSDPTPLDRRLRALDVLGRARALAATHVDEGQMVDTVEPRKASPQ